VFQRFSSDPSNPHDRPQREEIPMFRRYARLILVSVPILGLFLLGFASSAVADPPSREPGSPPTGASFPFQDTKGNNPCGFEVDLLVLNNSQVVTTFGRKGATAIQAAGAFTVRLTNSSNGTSIDLNISGPTHLTVNADGSITQIALGPQLWVFDPGVAPTLPRLALIDGRTVSMFDAAGNFSWISTTGKSRDLCIPLSAA
jgi:hypothetical protein